MIRNKSTTLFLTKYVQKNNELTNDRKLSSLVAGYINAKNSVKQKPHPDIVQELYNGEIMYDTHRCSATHKVPTENTIKVFKLSKIRTSYDVGKDIAGNKPQYVVHYEEKHTSESLKSFKKKPELTKYFNETERKEKIMRNMTHQRALDLQKEQTSLNEISQKAFDELESKLKKNNIQSDD